MDLKIKIKNIMGDKIPTGCLKNNFIFSNNIKIEPWEEENFQWDKNGTVFTESVSKSNQSKLEPQVKVEENHRTFYGSWSEEDDDFDIYEVEDPEGEKPSRRKKTKERHQNLSEAELKLGGIAFAKHKIRNLRGVPSCRYCDTIFATMADKKQHVCKYLQCDEKNFICRFCGKERSKATFSNHVHEAVECQYCGKKILNPRNMKLHIQNKHKGESYIPPKERSIEELDNYLKQKMKEEAEIYAKREKIKQDEYQNRIKQLREKYNKKNIRYQCDLCGNCYSSHKSLEYHMNMHLNIPYSICENCGIQVFSPLGAKKHSCNKKFDDPVKNSRYCRYCNIQFDSTAVKKNHQCEYQIDKRNKICRLCRKVIPKSSFNHHIETHSEEFVSCEVCSRQFSNKRCLKVHILTHSEDKPFHCDQCPETFISKRCLEYHKRFHGEKLEKTFKCEYCFTTLCSEFSLKNHIQRKHSVSAICEICKVECQTKELLKEHIKSSHNPFECSVCSKSFALPRYLKVN